MKSVKPGRGPSMMGGVASVFAVVFGIIWMCGAASMGAPGFFLLFGVAFIGIGVVNAVYSFKNAAGENRYSAYDIVDSDEEPDPLDERFGRQPDNAAPPQAGKTGTTRQSSAQGRPKSCASTVPAVPAWRWILKVRVST